MSYVPGTPTSIEATALRKIAWDEKLTADSVRPSVMTNIKTEFKIFNNEIIMSKPGVLLDVTNVGKGQMGQSVRLALRTPLKQRARYGTEQALGNEDESTLLYTECFYNEIKKAVKMYQYGYYANDVAPYGFNEGYTSQLTDFHAENEDTFMQQALLQVISEPLAYAPLSKSFGWNPNWAIPNLSYSDYPTWDITDANTVSAAAADTYNYQARSFSNQTSFTQNIAAAMVSASGVTGTPKATLTVDALAEITSNIINFHMVEPVMMDGIPSYIFKISPATAGWMKNPSNTGSLAAHWINIAQYKANDRDILPGEWGRIFEQFILVVDPRCPTIQVTGGSTAYTLSPNYVWPGNVDNRNNTAWSATSGSTNHVWDVCAVLGKNALMKYTRDNLKGGLVETTEYDQIKGLSTYKGEGIQLPIFDKGTPTSTSKIYRGSCIIPVSRAAIAAHT